MTYSSLQILGYCLNDLSNVSLRMDCMSRPPIVAVNDINAHSSALSHKTTFNVDIPLSYQDRKCSVDLVLENTVDYQRDIGIVNSNNFIHKFICALMTLLYL